MDNSIQDMDETFEYSEEKIFSPIWRRKSISSVETNCC